MSLPLYPTGSPSASEELPSGACRAFVLVLLMKYSINQSVFNVTLFKERPAERGRLHQVGERHQPVQAPPRRDHQLAEEHRGARGAGGGVRPAPLR